MNDSVLKSLLKEYEIKRMHAIKDAETRKDNLYSENPRLQEIEKELNDCAISTAKNILFNNSYEAIDNLKNTISNLKNEKKVILSKLNISEDYLKPIFECNLCNDTGYITNNSETILCNCLKQKIFDMEYNKSNIYNIKNDTFSNFSLDFYSDIVDEKKYKVDISPRENMNIIKDICMSFIDNFDNPDEKNLLFRGNTGLGKTFLSSCIANELLKKGKTVLYQTAPIMLDSIVDYRFGKNNSNLLENLLSVDLLIIDDLGTESLNSMKFTELFNIINTRLLNQNNKITKTIISTNLTMKNLSEMYDERIISRFVGYYNILPFFGEDIRFKK